MYRRSVRSHLTSATRRSLVFGSVLVRGHWGLVHFSIVGALCVFTWLPTGAHAGTEIIQREVRDKTFADVLFDLEFAITQRNFRITARNDIGRGIRKRGVEDFPQAMVIHFCNLTDAQEALELDPVFITHMPCRIAVYDHGDRISVSTTRLPEDFHDPRVNAFSRRINEKLREILDFAVEPVP